MRINNKLQNGLLLVLYLSRSGRANIATIARNLNLPRYFLDQIARKLRIGNIIKSVRGPGGGYELIGAPTVGSVFFALSHNSLLTQHEASSYRRGELEHRALARLVEDFSFSLSPVYNRSIKSVVTELVQSEKVMLERASDVIATRIN